MPKDVKLSVRVICHSNSTHSCVFFPLSCNSRLYGSMLSVCRHFIAMTTVANYNHGNRRHFIAMATVATFSLLPSSFEVLLPFEHVVKLSVKDLNSLAKT